MPKKNSLNISQELMEETLTKPKRQISDAQREHLNNIDF